jgi:pyruvate-formate lyase
MNAVDAVKEAAVGKHEVKSSGLRRFAALIDQYFAQGGMQIQFNVVSKKTLRDAQAHPEAYADLLIRVAGYSAYFTQLSREVQEDIIARTEQRL